MLKRIAELMAPSANEKSHELTLNVEANLPRAQLSQDLVLKASGAQDTVDNWIVAPKNANQPCSSNGAQQPRGDDSSGTGFLNVVS